MYDRDMKQALLFAASVFFLAAGTAYAHGDKNSFEQNVDDHFVDIGYDVPFSVGNDTLLDFDVFDLKGGNSRGPSDYSSIAISLESGSVIQWKRSVAKPDFGKPVTSLVPERPGHWKFRAVFLHGSAVVVDAGFPIDVLGSDKRNNVAAPFVFAGIIIFLFAFAVFSFRRQTT